MHSNKNGVRQAYISENKNSNILTKIKVIRFIFNFGIFTGNHNGVDH